MNYRRLIGSACAGVALVGLLAGSAVPAQSTTPLLERRAVAAASDVATATRVPVTRAAARSSADDPVNRVVAISVDG
ncbi:MAG TPA: hypothetical protein VM428_00375 [Microlunatus sp.]|nr:hypothetical protein [Microlunatus sp.]